MTTNVTPTQRFILKTAAVSLNGVVAFAAGDRKGTRIGWRDDFGKPWIIAYCTPEHFLKGRGYLEPYGNERNVYRITDLGREVIKPKRAAA